MRSLLELSSEFPRNIFLRITKKQIPEWADTSEYLYEEFVENRNQEIADELIDSFDNARREKWL